MNIVVLAGGLSNERDVSLSSGAMIANALIKNGHSVLLLDVYKGINLDNTNELTSLFKNKSSHFKYEYNVPTIEPNLEELKKENHNQTALIGENVIKLCKYSDLVFLALHGSIGENGQIQATFDALDIKYTGSGYVGSYLAFDKNMAKDLLSLEKKVALASSKLYKYNEDIKIDKFPKVIKPNANGSSIGVSIVHNLDEFDKAISLVQSFKDDILVEDYILGREIQVGILGETILPTIEIIPNDGFYDYEAKYQKNLALEECPAHLTAEETKQIRDLAFYIFKKLKLSIYARIDFIYSDHKFYFLEANTLPGMTPTSLLPQEASSANISYEELCEEIMHLSLAKYK